MQKKFLLYLKILEQAHKKSIKAKNFIFDNKIRLNSKYIKTK